MSDLPTLTVTTNEIRHTTTLTLNPRGHYLYPEQYGFDRVLSWCYFQKMEGVDPNLAKPILEKMAQSAGLGMIHFRWCQVQRSPASGKQEHLVRVTKYLELTPEMVLF
jgi:hypothetical protein